MPFSPPCHPVRNHVLTISRSTMQPFKVANNEAAMAMAPCRRRRVNRITNNAQCDMTSYALGHHSINTIKLILLIDLRARWSRRAFERAHFRRVPLTIFVRWRGRCGQSTFARCCSLAVPRRPVSRKRASQCSLCLVRERSKRVSVRFVRCCHSLPLARSSQQKFHPRFCSCESE